MTLEDDYTAPAAEPVMWRAVDYAQHIAKRFRDREVDEVFLVYTRLVNALSSEAECMRLLPLEASSFQNGRSATRRIGRLRGSI